MFNKEECYKWHYDWLKYNTPSVFSAEEVDLLAKLCVTRALFQRRKEFEEADLVRSWLQMRGIDVMVMDKERRGPMRKDSAYGFRNQAQ